MLEAQIIIEQSAGQVSQSAQFAPYDDGYYPIDNSSTSVLLYNPSITSVNTYVGSYYQQAVSSLTTVDNDVYYAGGSGDFRTFGVEYKSNIESRKDGYVTWYSQGKESWTMKATAVGPNPMTEIGQRLIAEEPMAMVSSPVPPLTNPQTLGQ